MDTITNNDLELLVNILNRATNSPMGPYGRDSNGEYITNKGHYHIHHAQDGYKLVRIINNTGKTINVSAEGLHSKESIATQLRTVLNVLREQYEY